MTRSAEPRSLVHTDVIVVGGGVAGLWLLARLRRAGYGALLLESDRLGAGQTRYAQGIIHGGTKYSLHGALSDSAQAVADMPARWRASLAGKGEVDLRDARLLSAHHYLWSTASIGSRMSGFLASHAMRARTRICKGEDRPAPFRDPAFRGQVYALDEPVVDALSVVRTLAEAMSDQVLRVRGAQALELTLNQDARLRLSDPAAGVLELRAQRLVYCAGAGNEGLLAAVGRNTPGMQRRPLHMALAKGPLPPLFAHCLGGGVNPRITVTSHVHRDGTPVWYLGGQLAEDGVQREPAAQVAEAKRLLADLLPWVDVSRVAWQTLRVDRAEPRQADGGRPARAFVHRDGPLLTAWPVKLALAPLLADQVLAKLGELQCGRHSQAEPPNWPRPQLAPAPWDELQWN